jgi:hypothetical protein
MIIAIIVIALLSETVTICGRTHVPMTHYYHEIVRRRRTEIITFSILLRNAIFAIMQHCLSFGRVCSTYA